MSTMASSSAMRKTILLTGCNSGIGLVAAKKLHEQGHKLILVARTLAKAQATKTAILSDLDTEILTVECDQSEVKSIQECIKTTLALNVTLDVLCLNAGMCTARNSEPQFTDDGIELTLMSNHFGPFLLLHGLKPMLHSKSRIVLTASSTHEKSTFGDFEGVRDNEKIVNLDGSEFDYFKSYSQSKLCNVALTMQLHERLDEIQVCCFSPGLMTSTGLFQHQSSILMWLFGFAANYLFKFGETVDFGGGALAWIATSPNVEGGVYYKSVKTGASNKGINIDYDNLMAPYDISPEAASKDNQIKLWDLSGKLMNIDPNL